MSLRLVRRMAWLTLIYMILVILWGAFVRATGSGAGCGDHWPLCNGTVVPRAAALETIIELTHRLTSGVSLALVVILFFMSRRVVPKGHGLRSAANWSLGFILAEALIGAGLVLFELVAHNASLKRVFSMSAHLANTFALLAALSLVIWRSSPNPHSHSVTCFSRADLSTLRLPLFGALLLILAGMSGAIAALGDTLYSAVGALPLQAYVDGDVPFLLRLRIIHPFLAVAAGGYLLWLQTHWANFHDDSTFAKLSWAVSSFTLLQIGLGFANVALAAPIWMQLVHLGVGVLLWTAFVFQSFIFHSKSK
ncbi:heme A synthase [bacterium]|nr:heme A synthase [bacterium]